ncbi:hypothetical protein PIB19_17360 [Sphingomonas sp. 7/4-4]|uniref:hypothetical protein n=1 Tax=Sphingomonas sp. 7/4-4 TaxID=3018446 RepID=UPI0022F39C26|nr:hypothetical protein [Sphingomonas sp. 7/4-4]WBY07159.1 hypothetical protein PIB19_17360 [Sphingomonas sp. 7/4-4]
MNRSFRHALLSSALLLLPTGPAFAAMDPDPVADEDTQSQDKAEIVVTGSVATQSSSATGLTLSPARRRNR